MLTDVGGLGMALAAIHVADRSGPDRQRTFGLYRLEILAALANAVLLFGVALYVLCRGGPPLGRRPEVLAGPMLVVAVLGLVANLVAFLLLREGSTESLNVEGAYLEVLSDLVGSVGVIVAAGVIAVTGWAWVDPAVGVAIGLFILPRTWRLAGRRCGSWCRRPPPASTSAALEADLRGLDGVVDVHDLHVWTLTSEMDVASVHLMVADGTDTHGVLDRARVVMRDAASTTPPSRSSPTPHRLRRRCPGSGLADVRGGDCHVASQRRRSTDITTGKSVRHRPQRGRLDGRHPDRHRRRRAPRRQAQHGVAGPDHRPGQGHARPRWGRAGVLPRDLLVATAGLDEGALDDEQFATFSRLALAAITQAGLQFEAFLMAGFGLEIARADDYTDPRITYLLHEVGEGPATPGCSSGCSSSSARPPATPWTTGWWRPWAGGWSTRSSSGRRCCSPWCWPARRSPTCCRSGRPTTPGTDPFVREVNRYHRQEEARHLAFARMLLPEVWHGPAGRPVAGVARGPVLIREMYENMIHAGVFAAVGLPGVPHLAGGPHHPGGSRSAPPPPRPVLDALIDAGAIERARSPGPGRACAASTRTAPRAAGTGVRSCTARRRPASGDGPQDDLGVLGRGDAEVGELGSRCSSPAGRGPVAPGQVGRHHEPVGPTRLGLQRPGRQAQGLVGSPPRVSSPARTAATNRADSRSRWGSAHSSYRRRRSAPVQADPRRYRSRAADGSPARSASPPGRAVLQLPGVDRQPAVGGQPSVAPSVRTKNEGAPPAGPAPAPSAGTTA